MIETRTLLERALIVLKGSSSYLNAETCLYVQGIDKNKLISDIADVLRAADKKVSERPDATLNDIVAAIDRMTEQQDRALAGYTIDRDARLLRDEEAIKAYRSQAARDEERLARQRKIWAEQDTQRPLMSNNTRFDVDGVLCRFQSVLDARYYIVVADDGTHHRILIEGAKEANHEA